MGIDLTKCKDFTYEQLDEAASCHSNSTTSRAANICVDLYNNYEPVHMADSLADALADIRHACDLLSISFYELDKQAHKNYLQDKSDKGIAKL